MFPKFNPSYIGNKMTKNKMSVRALRDFEKHLKDDILVEESLVVKVVPIRETLAELVEREDTEYCRSTGRCGLSSEQLNGNLLDS